MTKEERKNVAYWDRLAATVALTENLKQELGNNRKDANDNGNGCTSLGDSILALCFSSSSQVYFRPTFWGCLKMAAGLLKVAIEGKFAKSIIIVKG